MQAEQQSERERFEAWCKLDNPRYDPTDDSPLNRRDWKIWQAALSHPSTPQGWISVLDCLPDLPEECEDDGVKVYTWNGDFVDEDVFAPEWEQPAGPCVGGWVRTGDWFCSDTANRVTHWMIRHAPPPPEQGSKG